MADILLLLDKEVYKVGGLTLVYNEVILRADELGVEERLSLIARSERFGEIFYSMIGSHMYTEAEYLLSRASVFGINNHRARVDQFRALLTLPMVRDPLFDAERVFVMIIQVMEALVPMMHRNKGAKVTLALTHVKTMVHNYVNNWLHLCEIKVCSDKMSFGIWNTIMLLTDINPRAMGWVLEKTQWRGLLHVDRWIQRSVGELKLDCSPLGCHSVFIYCCILYSKPVLVRLFITKGGMDFTSRQPIHHYLHRPDDTTEMTPLEYAKYCLKIGSPLQIKERQEIVTILQCAETMLLLARWSHKQNKLNADCLKPLKRMLFY